MPHYAYLVDAELKERELVLPDYVPTIVTPVFKLPRISDDWSDPQFSSPQTVEWQVSSRWANEDGSTAAIYRRK